MLARQIAIGFGIAIILPLLVYYGVSALHPAPKWQAFHTAMESPKPTATDEERKAFFDKQQADNEAYAAAAQEFARILIIAATPLGIGAILIGAYMRLHAIGTGLILGGILTVADGYWSYWQYLEDSVRFVSLLAGFVVLLFVGYRQIPVNRAGPLAR
jgi:hypothetical protein